MTCFSRLVENRWWIGINKARAQFLSSLGGMPSIPIALETSSDSRAFSTSSWDIEILAIDIGGGGRVSIGGRQYELVVKTEWKNLLKRDALSKSEEANNVLNWT